MNPEERDYAIRTLFGEAATDPASQAAVASVILNRAKQSGASVKDVVLAPNQFEPWSTRKKELLGLDQNSDEYKNLGTILDAVASGQTPDPTGGATLFYAPAAQKALGRSAPSWATGEGTQIGAHKFYKGNFPSPSMNNIVSGLSVPGITATQPVELPSPEKKETKPKLTPFVSQTDEATELLAIALENQGLPASHISAVTGLVKGPDGKWQTATKNSQENTQL